MAWRPKTAMVLGAGLGMRMRPLTDNLPKPLVPLAGRPMIDHVIDSLEHNGVETVVVNVHYLADKLVAHLAQRRGARIVISDERDALLDTGGGVVKALPLLGADPFYIHNSDSITTGGLGHNLERLAAAFDPERMDTILLLARATTALGYSGNGDFLMSSDGIISRRSEREIAPFVSTGVSIATPAMFRSAPTGPFSLNLLWDHAIAAGRLHGVRQDGVWMHIGSPDALEQAERYVSVGETYF